MVSEKSPPNVPFVQIPLHTSCFKLKLAKLSRTMGKTTLNMIYGGKV